jgi:hypothetical protein
MGRQEEFRNGTNLHPFMGNQAAKGHFAPVPGHLNPVVLALLTGEAGV